MVAISRGGFEGAGHTVGPHRFIRAHLEKTSADSADSQVLFDRIPFVDDVQSSWLLWVHIEAVRVTYLVQVVEPATVADFCKTHDVFVFYVQMSFQEAIHVAIVAPVWVVCGLRLAEGDRPVTS